MVLVTQKRKQTPAHEKRRYGQHHKHSKKYHHTYWPYLPLALIITLGVAVSNSWPTLQSAILGYSTNTSVNGLLLETNKERVASGAGKLALNSQLSAAAQVKAEDMASRDYWSHNTPEGNPPWVFIEQAGYTYTAAGENLAYGFDSSIATVAGWMGSPPHRQNLLASGYVHAGFGIANAENYQGSGQQTIVVALYASPTPVAEAAPAPPAATAQEPEPVTEPETQAESTEEQSPEPTEAAQKPNKESATAANDKEQKDSEQTQPRQVARLELISGKTAGWAVATATAIAAVAAAVFIFRHSLFWHRTIVKGEKFVIRHHFLDVVLITLAVVALILVQAAGKIY